MTFRGVTAGRAIEEDTLIVDVGGGSTELCWAGPRRLVPHEPRARLRAYDRAIRRRSRRLRDARPLGAPRPRAPSRHRCRRHGDVARGARSRPRRVRSRARPRPRALPRGCRGAARAAGCAASGATASRAGTRAGARAGDRRRRRHRSRGAGAIRADGLEASEHDILHGAALAAAELPEPMRASPARRVHLLLRYGLVASNTGSFSKPGNVVSPRGSRRGGRLGGSLPLGSPRVGLGRPRGRSMGHARRRRSAHRTPAAGHLRDACAQAQAASARAPGRHPRRASDGRAVLGAGIGGNRKEFEEFGESFDSERRWTLLEDGLERSESSGRARSARGRSRSGSAATALVRAALQRVRRLAPRLHVAHGDEHGA